MSDDSHTPTGRLGKPRIALKSEGFKSVHAAPSKRKFNFYTESRKYMKGSTRAWKFYLRLPRVYLRYKWLSRGDK